LKLGIIEDSTNRKKLASLARWFTTHNSSDFFSLDDYISRMKPTQEQIYFFSGEDKRVLEKSPLVKGLVKKGYEVLLCDDPIDEYVFSTLKDYEGKVIVFIIAEYR
jgi:heat shock protein beta